MLGFINRKVSYVIVRVLSRVLRHPFLRDAISSREDVNRLVKMNLSTMMLHRETFPRFRCANEGREVAVLASGPSLAQYRPIPGCCHIGVNHAFLKSSVPLDYLFAQDYRSVSKVMDEMNSYRPAECVKFYGLSAEYDLNLNTIIPESDRLKAGALRYRTDVAPMLRQCPEFAYDLSTQPLGDFGSVVFAALQFALWTHPKRIYLVGCDCSGTGHFFDKDKTCDLTHPGVYSDMVGGYVLFKKFASSYYPDVEIVSVNPVGLKGMFRDVVQDTIQ